MKNIILQHWSGELNQLTKLSSTNISKYAAKIGADYKLLRGEVFRTNLKIPHPPLQKLHMLDEVFDEYDMVVMLDADMFTRKGMNDDIFKDGNGIGVHTVVQERLVKHLCRVMPTIANTEFCYWGGSIYRLNRKERQKLRAGIKEDEIHLFCKRANHGDEGLMHALAVRAKIKDKYIPDTHWNYPSFWEDVGSSGIIHIRTKYNMAGKKRPKMENYKKLVEDGIIEE